jgi:hypothetical protein
MTSQNSPNSMTVDAMIQNSKDDYSISDVHQDTPNPSVLSVRNSEIFPTFEEFLEIKESNLLKNRKDVVNKSILRAIKRLFTLKFKQEYYIPRFRCQKKKRAKLLDSMTRFHGSLIPQIDNRMYLPEIQHTLELIILILDVSKNKKLSPKAGINFNKHAWEFYLKFEDCCRLYSHEKFQNLIENPLFYWLFTAFIHNLTPRLMRQMAIFQENCESYYSALNSLADELQTPTIPLYFDNLTIS